MKTITGNKLDETWEAKGSQLAEAQSSNSRAQCKCRIIKNQNPCILERNWKRVRQNNVTRVRVQDKVRHWQEFLFRVTVSTRVNYWTVPTREMQSDWSY